MIDASRLGYPIATEPVPPFYLRHPHLHTLFAGLFQHAPRLHYRRERRETADGDFVDLDWLDGPAGAPLLIATHGFEGSSQSLYMRRLLGQAQARGWSGVVLHHRGCSGEPNRNLGAYHSGRTDDVAAVVKRAAAAVPGRPIVLAGYSLGGNIMACWLARQADEVPGEVRGAVFIGAPLLLEYSARFTTTGLNRLYLYNFLRSCRPKAAGKAARFPGSFDVRASTHACTLPQFDDAFTARIFGFAGWRDYYRRASAYHDLPAIRVPTLLMAAADDPLVPPGVVPPQEMLRGTNVQVLLTRYGGHLGFIDRHDRWWLERRILGWLEQHLAT